MEKTILGVIPGLQATALVADNLKMVKFGPKANHKASTKNLVRGSMRNIVGIGLIGATSGMINKL